MEDLEELVKKAAMKADQAEIFYLVKTSTSFRGIADKINFSRSSFSKGYALRVIKDGKMGVSYFYNPSEFDRALNTAIYASRFAEKLGIQFPLKKAFTEVKGVYDKKLLKKDENELSDCIVQMIDTVKRKGAMPIRCGAGRNESFFCMLNSEGGEFKSKRTGFSAHSTARFKDTAQTSDKSSHSFFNPVELAEKSADLALAFAEGKPTSGEFDIVIPPTLVANFLRLEPFASFSGEKAFRKDSYFSGKKGKKVADDQLNVYDDPTIPNGMGSVKCDDEGVAANRKALIRNGILNILLYNLETARRAKTKTTGSGFRNSVSHPLGSGPTNLVITSKNITHLDDFKGIMVNSLIAMQNLNQRNGNFSCSIASGAFFNGEIGKPIKGCSLVGNFFDILKNVSLADDEQVYHKYYGPSWTFRGKIV